MKNIIRITVSAKQSPPPHPFYGENWHRGLDPWHVEAFPAGHKFASLHTGKRKGGWFLEDAFGNEIDFVADGTVFDVEEDLMKKQQSKAAPPMGGSETGVALPGTAGSLPGAPPMIDLNKAMRQALQIWEVDPEAGNDYWLRARRLAGQKV